MTSQEIIENIYKLQLLLKEKNGPISRALERATISLIENEKQLNSASREDILKIKGIGNVTADLILRIIKGEHVYKIASEVPKSKRKPRWE